MRWNKYEAANHEEGVERMKAVVLAEGGPRYGCGDKRGGKDRCCSLYIFDNARGSGLWGRYATCSVASFSRAPVLGMQVSVDMMDSGGGLHLWSAEEPNLYILVLKLYNKEGHFLESESCQVAPPPSCPPSS